MKVNAVNPNAHLHLITRQNEMAREDKRRDDHVKTVRADNIQAYKTLIYNKECEMIWLIQHNRIGGSVDITA